MQKLFFVLFCFKGKRSSCKMGLVFDLVRQQHNETKTQDITCFQSHKMTLLSIHFCRLLCFGGGEELSTQCWRKYFSRVRVYSQRGKKGFFQHIAMIFKKYKIKFTKNWKTKYKQSDIHCSVQHYHNDFQHKSKRFMISSILNNCQYNL